MKRLRVDTTSLTVLVIVILLYFLSIYLFLKPTFIQGWFTERNAPPSAEHRKFQPLSYRDTHRRRCDLSCDLRRLQVDDIISLLRLTTGGVWWGRVGGELICEVVLRSRG